MLFLANPLALSGLCSEVKFSSKAVSLGFRGVAKFNRAALLCAEGKVKRLAPNEAPKAAGPAWKGKQNSEDHSFPN